MIIRKLRKLIGESTFAGPHHAQIRGKRRCRPNKPCRILQGKVRHQEGIGEEEGQKHILPLLDSHQAESGPLAVSEP
jgi:hypothetical protein